MESVVGGKAGQWLTAKAASIALLPRDAGIPLLRRVAQGMLRPNHQRNRAAGLP